MVNTRIVSIFKGIFQTRKSAQSAEKIAKIGLWNACRAAVNHERINHGAALPNARPAWRNLMKGGGIMKKVLRKPRTRSGGRAPMP